MTVVCESASNFKSTLELTNTIPGNHRINNDRDNKQIPQENADDENANDESSTSKIFRIVWHTMYEKYENIRRQSRILKNFVCRESNKPMAKKFRRTMRLNKSAKNKGYEYFMSDEDKR